MSKSFEMATISEFLANGYQPDLLAYYLNIKKGDLYLDLGREIAPDSIEMLVAAKSQLDLGVPFEYITKEVIFWNLRFMINSHVLIPRVETEILLDHVIKRLKTSRNLIVWDICTGSGCLGIALKKTFPSFQVSLSDLSEKALEVAAFNAKAHDVDVGLYQGDLLDPFQGKKADVIICNPPYISEIEYETLDPSVYNFEPKEALLAGKSGLEFYEKMEKEMGKFLSSGAKVFFEIGHLQGKAMERLFSSSTWTRQELLFDWAGKARFFLLEKQ